MNQERWQRFLDSAANPPSLTSKDQCRIDETLAAIKYATQDWKPGRVLVLGCGDGAELDHFISLGFEPVGVTFQKDEQGHKNIVEADIHELPFKDEEFDYVYSRETLEHLLCPFMGVFEAMRVLKTGSRFCHYISTGPEKQREWYHFSSAVDFYWFDMFFKAGADIKMTRQIIVSGNDSIQTSFEGMKREQRDLEKPIEGYPLDKYLKQSYREPLDLIDHRLCQRQW